MDRGLTFGLLRGVDSPSEDELPIDADLNTTGGFSDIDFGFNFADREGSFSFGEGAERVDPRVVFGIAEVGVLSSLISNFGAVTSLTTS